MSHLHGREPRKLGPLSTGIIVMPRADPPCAASPYPPDIIWPLVTACWSALWASLWTALTIVDSINFLPWVVISLAATFAAEAWYDRRLKARAQWRHERALAWYLKPPLAAPVYTDWIEYEECAGPDNPNPWRS